MPCERVNHPSRSAPPSINLFCGAMATPRIDCLVALFFPLLFKRSPFFLRGSGKVCAVWVRLQPSAVRSPHPQADKVARWQMVGRLFLSRETWLAPWESAHGRLGTVGTCDPRRGPDLERRPGFSAKINLEKKKPP